MKLTSLEANATALYKSDVRYLIVGGLAVATGNCETRFGRA